jgi:hypothetical protein
MYVYFTGNSAVVFKSLLPAWQHLCGLWLSSLPTDCWNFDCTPLLTDLFLYSYDAEFIQKLIQEKNKSLAFNSIFGFTDDVSSINNEQVHSYVDFIYPDELEIKDTTESSNGYFCFILGYLIENRYLRQANNPNVWQTGWFQFCSYIGSYIQYYQHMAYTSLSWFDMQGPALHMISF